MLWRSRQSPDLLILTQAQTLAMTTVAAQPEPHKGTAVGPPDPVVVARMLTQRGELAPNGRPWYDELYLNGAGSCCGAIFRLYIWPFIVLPHYLLVSDVIERGKFVPYKCLALVVFYGLAFPHFFIERRDLEARTLFEKGGEGDGGSILWSFYKTAVSFILYLPYYIYAVFVVVPLTHLLCRSEAALELLLVYFQDQLDWTKGWSIPSQQFILGTKRRDPKAVAVRRFDADGRVIGRVVVRTHKELEGLANLPDSAPTDKYINALTLSGYAFDRHEGRKEPHWVELASRFVYFCTTRSRALWTSRGKHPYFANLWLFVCNSQATSFVSIRLAIKFHPLTRNERFLIMLMRLSLTAFFASVMVSEGSEDGLPTIFGFVTFVIVLIQTQIARATCHVGRPTQCKSCGPCCGCCGSCCCCCRSCCTKKGWDVEACGEWATHFVLVSSFVAFFVMGLVTVLVTLTDETIEKEKKNEFGVDFVEGLLISEAMAWATGWLQFTLRMRSEKKSVLQTATSLGLKDPQYDEWTTSLHYMREFMSHYQWPEDLMGPPERYTVQSLLARIHPRFKDGKVIGEWDGEGPPPEMEEGMGAFHGIEVAPASQDIV